MDWYIWIIIAFVIMAAIYVALMWVAKQLPNKMPYELNSSILTNRELEFYKKLKPAADELNLVICPKVRLADIVSVQKGEKERNKYFNKIQAKHIDFVLCDSDMKFKVLVELDDSTHNRADRRQSDEFKNELFKQVQLPLIRFNSLKEDPKPAIETALNQPIAYTS